MAEPVPAAGGVSSRWELTPSGRTFLRSFFFSSSRSRCSRRSSRATSDAHRHRAGDRSIPDHRGQGVPELPVPRSIQSERGMGFPGDPLPCVFRRRLLRRLLPLLAAVFAIFLSCTVGPYCGGAPPYRGSRHLAFSGFLRIRIQPRTGTLHVLFHRADDLLFLRIFLRYEEEAHLPVSAPRSCLGEFTTRRTDVVPPLRGVRRGSAGSRNLAERVPVGDLEGVIFPPVLVGLAGLILCGLNPHGYNAILTPLHLISRGTGGGGGGGSMLMSISELTRYGTGFFVYYKAAARLPLSLSSSAWRTPGVPVGSLPVRHRFQGRLGFRARRFDDGLFLSQGHRSTSPASFPGFGMVSPTRPWGRRSSPPRRNSERRRRLHFVKRTRLSGGIGPRTHRYRFPGRVRPDRLRRHHARLLLLAAGVWARYDRA